jgi:uncharacterized protein YceK
MKRSLVIMVGLVLALSGCSSGRATTASSTSTPTAESSSSTSPTSEATTSSAGQSPTPELRALQDQLRQARQKLEAQYNANPKFSGGCFKPPFILSAPSDLTGYVVASVDAPDMMWSGATVTVRLVDQADPGRWVELYEQMGCYGVLPYAPTGATNVVDWHNVDTPACSTLSPSQSLSWTQPDGSNEMILVPGCGPTYPPEVLGTGFMLKGHNVDQDALFRLFSSLQPVSE